MTVLESVVLGAIQGITEFLPISSSGHLILAREFFGIGDVGGLAVDAVLQLASCLAVILYFRAEIRLMIVSAFALVLGRYRRQEEGIEGNVLLGAIALGTIPAVILGAILEPYMEGAFRSVAFVAVTLVLGSLLMSIAESVWRWRTNNGVGFEPMSIRRGGYVGLFQALALMPGVSRSGATISGALLLGLSRDQAARFSFLLAVPVIFGSGLKKLLDGVDLSLALWIGAAVSFAVSLAAIHWLLVYLRRHTMMPFVWYRLALAAVLFAFFV